MARRCQFSTTVRRAKFFHWEDLSFFLGGVPPFPLALNRLVFPPEFLCIIYSPINDQETFSITIVIIWKNTARV